MKPAAPEDGWTKERHLKKKQKKRKTKSTWTSSLDYVDIQTLTPGATLHFVSDTCSQPLAAQHCPRHCYPSMLLGLSIFLCLWIGGLLSAGYVIGPWSHLSERGIISGASGPKGPSRENLLESETQTQTERKNTTMSSHVTRVIR